MLSQALSSEHSPSQGRASPSSLLLGSLQVAGILPAPSGCCFSKQHRCSAERKPSSKGGGKKKKKNLFQPLSHAINISSFFFCQKERKFLLPAGLPSHHHAYLWLSPGCQPLHTDGKCKAHIPSTRPLLHPSAAAPEPAARCGEASRGRQGWAKHPAKQNSRLIQGLHTRPALGPPRWTRGSHCPSLAAAAGRHLSVATITKPVVIPPPRKLSIRHHLCQASCFFSLNLMSIKYFAFKLFCRLSQLNSASQSRQNNLVVSETDSP